MRKDLLTNVMLISSMALLLASGPVLAQAQGSPQTMGQGRMSTPSPNPTMTQPGTPDTTQMRVKVDDKQFVREAATNGMTEAAMGKLAADKGSMDAVKQFGQKIADDWTKTSPDLKKLGEAESVSMADSLDAKHQVRVDKLAKLSGTAFDKAYLKEQLKDQQENVRKYQEEAQNGSVAEVKNYAAKALPALQEQLASAKELKKGENNSASADRSKQ